MLRGPRGRRISALYKEASGLQSASPCPNVTRAARKTDFSTI
ncbi:hypothetical protein HanXRQr2_Chr16g0760271 [Helianthus annuus]|uniref:Uncharacterized protein n=1 Tax=Helianthus annuus TaxID=4232 RepID=A0A9K3DU41_HELAN|nr:hypothetical protein HanXRQr2_Chr16g0760271 [Helianthus annuus]